MAHKQLHLNRRTLLRGAGVALALPYLNAMEGVVKGNSDPTAKAAPKRFMATYISYGVYQPDGPNGIPRKKKDGQYEHHEWSWWPQGDLGEIKSFNKSTEPFSSLPKLHVVLVPARQAYSHSASVGKRYVLPSFSLSFLQYATASSQLTYTAG